MDSPALSTELCQRILRHLGMPADSPPTLDTLRLLLTRYTRTVPWESASRIARRAIHAREADCALLGEAFWESHFAQGSGGTCYESNYAVWGLLRWLGYEGYLTLNNMGESIACHSAIVVLIDGRKLLLDVGLPLHALMEVDSAFETSASSQFMDYRVAPQSRNRYEIWRSRPAGVAFTLVDEPVADAAYRQAAIHDYRHDGGLFLDKVVIGKVIDEQLWRFNSQEKPLVLQQFVDGQRRDHALTDAPAEVARKFGMARSVVARALENADPSC